MLDLIVLGIVPGTTFVITLWWALLFALIFSLMLLIYVEVKKPKQTTKTVQVSRPFVDLSNISIAGILNPIFHAPGRNLLLSRKSED